MRRWHGLLILLFALFVLPAAAQDATPEPTEEPLTYTPRTREELEAALEWTCPAEFEGQTLNVYNWGIYIADNTIPDFEVLCGVDVIYDNYVSNEEMIARLRQGNPGYDIVVPSGYVIAPMIEEGLLEPIDISLIPNFANVIESFQDPVYDPGNQYTVPYQWGTVGIAYSTERVAEAPTSWEDLFNYEGNVAWLEDVRAMLAIGLLMTGHDPNSTDEAEIQEAAQFLIDHSDNVVTIVTNNSQQLLTSGEVDMAIDYNGNVFQMGVACECDDYAYALPSEGSNVWIDNVAIPFGAPNVPLAHVFMDYLLIPQVGADISNYLAYASPNQASIDQGLILEDYLNSPIIYPDETVFETAFYTEAIPPEAEQLYTDAWDMVRLAISQR
jgi:spermidine/putrescine transport system substrate-binding protein